MLMMFDAIALGNGPNMIVNHLDFHRRLIQLYHLFEPNGISFILIIKNNS